MTGISRRGFTVACGAMGMDLLVKMFSGQAFAQPHCKTQPGYRIIDESESTKRKLNPQNLVGRQAPILHQRDMNTTSVSYREFVGPQDYKGRVVVLNFWATWCEVCHGEMPELQKIYRDHKKNLVVLSMEAPSSNWFGLSSLGRIDLAPEKVFGEKLTFPILEKRGRASYNFQVCTANGLSLFKKGKDSHRVGFYMGGYEYQVLNENLPLTFLIDREQKIRETIRGRISAEDLEKKLKPYL